jgi:hypothetical protein
VYERSTGARACQYKVTRQRNLAVQTRRHGVLHRRYDEGAVDLSHLQLALGTAAIASQAQVSPSANSVSPSSRRVSFVGDWRMTRRLGGKARLRGNLLQKVPGQAMVLGHLRQVKPPSQRREAIGRVIAQRPHQQPDHHSHRDHPGSPLSQPCSLPPQPRRIQNRRYYRPSCHLRPLAGQAGVHHRVVA